MWWKLKCRRIKLKIYKGRLHFVTGSDVTERSKQALRFIIPLKKCKVARNKAILQRWVLETKIYGMIWNWSTYFLFLKEKINSARMLPFFTYWWTKRTAAIQIQYFGMTYLQNALPLLFFTVCTTNYNMIAILTDFVQFIAIIFKMCFVVRTFPANHLRKRKIYNI